ncbi:transmembrane emp24 domain-containing 7 [Aphelenchoides avenae]|nr:transmembrane emp24 domain-containing 7 [Aphelenchus avenae]
MIARKWKSRTVTISLTVATAHGQRPLVGFSKEVDEAWEKLKKRHKVQSRWQNAVERSVSKSGLHFSHKAAALSRSNTSSDVGTVRLKFRELEMKEIEEKEDDVYSPNYVPKKYAKNSAEYGRPKPGTLTEMRAQKAARHIAKEMVEICEVIEEYGRRSGTTDKVVITFGDLFKIYQVISDKVVGILLRARKHNMVSFEGEMLFQRRDDDKIITLMRCLLILSALVGSLSAIELTFELPDNANQCFYEDIKSGIDSILEFQVVTGGQYDVDVVLEDPNGKILYKEARKQYDSHSFKTQTPGTYKVCFSNEFSTFSHKIVYMDWQVGDETGPNGKPTPRMVAMSQLETSAATIGDRLRLVDDYQTHHRLREATGRKEAEDLNERVLYWSLGQTAIILLVGIGQVLLLRSFFSDKRPAGGY